MEPLPRSTLGNQYNVGLFTTAHFSEAAWQVVDCRGRHNLKGVWERKAPSLRVENDYTTDWETIHSFAG